RPVPRTECPPTLARYLRLILPASASALPQQHEDRAAPSRTGESGAERARTPRRGHDRIELGRAAGVQASAGFVGLVQQLAEALQVPAAEDRKSTRLNSSH